MDLIRWEPMREMSSFRRQLDRFFDLEEMREMGRNLMRMGPRTDIYQTETEVIANVELPGIIEKDDVDILVSENALTIKGEMKRDTEKREEDYVRNERYFGSFNRTLSLPVEVSPDNTSASYKNGVLEIRMPKVQPDRRCGVKIDIN